MKGRGRKVTWWCVGFGAVLVVVAGVLAKDRIVEQSFLWRFQAAGDSAKWELIKTMAELGERFPSDSFRWLSQKDAVRSWNSSAGSFSRDSFAETLFRDLAPAVAKYSVTRLGVNSCRCIGATR